MLAPGFPLADAIAAADAALGRRNAPAVDAAYAAATLLIAPGTTTTDSDGRGHDLWMAVAVDHLVALRRLGAVTRGLRRCEDYLGRAAAAGVDPSLLLQERMQLRDCAADPRGAAADAAAMRRLAASGKRPISAAQDGRLLRAEASAAAAAGDAVTASRLLDDAERALRAAGCADVSIIDRDRALLRVRQGAEPDVGGALAEMLDGEWPETVESQFRLAFALKRQLHFEAAARVMTTVTGNPDLDPALRLPALYELVTLLLTMRDDRAAHALRPLLDAAAASWPDPAGAARKIALLLSSAPDPDPAPAPDPAPDPEPERAVRQVQRLIAADRLTEAESRLARLTPPADPLAAEPATDPGAGRTGTSTIEAAQEARDRAEWYLVAGELQLARYRQLRRPELLQAAVDDLGRAVRATAGRAWLTEVRILATRLLGEAHHWRAEYGQASARWAQAHQLEERLAGRQISDAVRVGMLAPVPDEHDERVRFAAERTAENAEGAAATAALVVAMEAARGAAILGGILPAEAGLTRDLPPPDDHRSAWAWIRATADRLPRSQVVWMMHATPLRVHHAVIGPNLLHHIAVDCRRGELGDAVDDLMGSWSAGTLESAVGRAAFDAGTRDIAARLDVAAVVRHLPPDIRRIALVVGGVLADVPFAALPLAVPVRSAGATAGRAMPLGLRFALSDLPCLSARSPLSRRSRRVRGDRSLLVDPAGEGITPARGIHAQVLDGARATPAELAATLARRRHRQVRLDCHGRYDPLDEAGRWLQLRPDDASGRLPPEALQAMDLHGCGTLVLGACESGMATRTGRDERLGFVRAALHAGAASVVAARWAAADPVAAAVLDRFHHHLRRRTRDVALWQAQLDVCRAAPDRQVLDCAPDHPARWACWTLYGDAGWQTGAGVARRGLRRAADHAPIRRR